MPNTDKGKEHTCMCMYKEMNCIIHKRIDVWDRAKTQIQYDVLYHM